MTRLKIIWVGLVITGGLLCAPVCILLYSMWEARLVASTENDKKILGISNSAGDFLWVERDGVLHLKHGIVRSTEVKRWGSGTIGAPPVNYRRDPRDHSEFSCSVVIGSRDLYINGEHMVSTEFGRIFALMPNGKVDRLILTKPEIDAITPQLVQNNPESSPVWRNKILPITNPAALIPVPEEVTRVRHELVNLIKRPKQLATYNGPSHGPDLGMFSLWTESSYGIFIQNGQMIRGRPRFMNAFMAPRFMVFPVSHDDEERTPSAHLTPTPGRDRPPIVEFLPTGMYIDGNLMEPGVIAVVQPDRTYKTVRLTEAECQEFYPLSLYQVIVDGEIIDKADHPHGEVGRKTIELYQRLIEPLVVMNQP